MPERTTIDQIAREPEAYLGEGATPEEYAAFVIAARLLVERCDLSEEAAISTVWHGGDWTGRAARISRAAAF